MLNIHECIWIDDWLWTMCLEEEMASPLNLSRFATALNVIS